VESRALFSPKNCLETNSGLETALPANPRPPFAAKMTNFIDDSIPLILFPMKLKTLREVKMATHESG
jgi:hypothetical protein